MAKSAFTKARTEAADELLFHGNELTRAQKLTMGAPITKETTNGKAADPEPAAADPGDQSAQENGNEHAD